MDTKYLAKKTLNFLIMLVSAGLTLYIGYHMFYGLTQKMESEPALMAEITESVQASAYIFRDEVCLPASSLSGSRVPAVSDGERVGVGDVVSRHYDVTAPDTVARIAGLQTQLEVIDQMRRQQLSIRDTAAVETEIYDILAGIAAIGTSGECGSALSLRASLQAAMSRRHLLSGSSSDIETVYTALTAERNAQISQLGACRAEQTTPCSGYYYAECDGYESLFSPQKAQNITAAEFEQLIGTEPKNSDCAGKIVRSTTWYAVCRLPAEREDDFTAGKSYELRFPYNEGETLTMRLLRTDSTEDEFLLVFSSDELPQGFRFTRAQTVVIGTRKIEGLRLPLSALRMSGRTTGVYILEGGVVRFRAVRILFEGEDYFLADPAPEEAPPEGMEWLQRNDFVITRGHGLTDGRVLA